MANARYRFEVGVYAPRSSEVVTNLVTDPYSLGLTTNSAALVLVDLDDRRSSPPGWNRLRKPALPKPEYSDDLRTARPGLLDQRRDRPGRPPRHLPGVHRPRQRRHAAPAAAREAGLNTVHLLPVNDIATIEEDRAAQQRRTATCASFPPDSEAAAGLRHARSPPGRLQLGLRPAALHRARGLVRDASRRGTARNREFREMVQGLNGAGQRVVMDVVYNHTPAAGQDPKSILDRIVPGYYHRLNPPPGRWRPPRAARTPPPSTR